MMLEKEHDIFKLELKYYDHNPLVYIVKFILGCIFAILSLLWWIHM